MDELEPPGSPWIPQMPAQIDPSAMAMFEAEHHRQMAAAREEHERRISEVAAANEQRLNAMQADNNRQMAELRSLLAQQQQQPQARQNTPTPIPSPAMPDAAQRPNRLDPDYNQKQQLKALALRQTEQKGGRAFAVYVKKLTAREETIYQPMMATLHRERKTMYLDDLMTIVENAESNRPNLPSTVTSTATPASSSTPAASTTAATGPTPMELDAVSVRGRGRGRGQGQEREKCFKCGGYGHHSYQCGTPDDYKPGGGLPSRGRGRGGYGGYGGRGDYGGRGRGGSSHCQPGEPA
jgi:hypothetical protein